MKTLPTFALLLAMSMMPGICPEEDDDRGYSFEYRLHHGLDCSQLSSCGFRIEITRMGVMQHFEETGSWVMTAEKQLSLEESEALKALLDEGGFWEYDPILPAEERVHGARTVWITFTDTASTYAKTVEASLDDTNTPFPTGFHTFESNLRTFLLTTIGMQTKR